MAHLILAIDLSLRVYTVSCCHVLDLLELISFQCGYNAFYFNDYADATLIMKSRNWEWNEE